MNLRRGVLRLWVVVLPVWLLFVAWGAEHISPGLLGQLFNPPPNTSSAEIRTAAEILSAVGLGIPLAVLALLLWLAWAVRGFTQT